MKGRVTTPRRLISTTPRDVTCSFRLRSAKPFIPDPLSFLPRHRCLQSPHSIHVLRGSGPKRGDTVTIVTRINRHSWQRTRHSRGKACSVIPAVRHLPVYLTITVIAPTPSDHR